MIKASYRVEEPLEDSPPKLSYDLNPYQDNKPMTRTGLVETLGYTHL
jgi:hypothetical protein